MFFVLLLYARGGNNIIQMFNVLSFPLQRTIQQEPVVDYEAQVTSQGGLLVDKAPFLKSIAHYGYEHVEHVDENDEHGKVEHEVEHKRLRAKTVLIRTRICTSQEYEQHVPNGAAKSFVSYRPLLLH